MNANISDRILNTEGAEGRKRGWDGFLCDLALSAVSQVIGSKHFPADITDDRPTSLRELRRAGGYNGRLKNYAAQAAHG